MCAKKGEIFTNDYPPVVIEPLRSLGIVQETAPTKKSDMIRKLIAMMIYAILFALVLYFINDITKILNAIITAYLLWLVVDWYDFLVINILLAPFDKFYKMAKVSLLKNQWFGFILKAV